MSPAISSQSSTLIGSASRASSSTFCRAPTFIQTQKSRLEVDFGGTTGPVLRADQARSQVLGNLVNRQFDPKPVGNPSATADHLDAVIAFGLLAVRE